MAYHCLLVTMFGVGNVFTILSYILLLYQAHDPSTDSKTIYGFTITYRSLYDLCMLFVQLLISIMCFYYLWQNHEQRLTETRKSMDNMDTTSSFIYFRKDSWTKLKQIYLYDVELEWNEFNISTIIFCMHQMLTFIYLLGNVLHEGSPSHHPKQDVLTAFTFLMEALTIILLSICLNAEHNPHFYVNREYALYHGASGHSLTNKELRKLKKKNLMNNNVIIFMIFITILCEFSEFLTYPSVNHDDFAEFIEDTYNCIGSDKNCTFKGHFIVNELIFRVFVGITLLNVIFFLLSILFGENPHFPTFNKANNLIRPCWFTLFLVSLFVEVAVIQESYTVDSMIFNMIWIIINIYIIILCIYYTTKHIKRGERNQWNKLNVTTKTEGLLLLILRTISLVFLFLDEFQDDNDWSLYRQIVITLSMYFFMATLWLLKKPPFIDDGVQYMLRMILYLNGYNLIYSLIFETSHFLQLLSYTTTKDGNEQIVVANTEHGNDLYFAISFSSSFGIAHSALWFLSQFWEWTLYQSTCHKMSDSKESNYSIALTTPKKNISDDDDYGQHSQQQYKSITILSHSKYSTFDDY